MLSMSVCVSFPTLEKTVQFERNLVQKLYRWSPFQRHNIEIFIRVNEKTKETANIWDEIDVVFRVLQ